MEDTRKECTLCRKFLPASAFEPQRRICRDCRRDQKNSNGGTFRAPKQTVPLPTAVEDRIEGNQRTLNTIPGRTIRSTEEYLDELGLPRACMDPDGDTEWVVFKQHMKKYDACIGEGQIVQLFWVELDLRRRKPVAISLPEFRSIEVVLPRATRYITLPVRPKRLALLVPDTQHGYMRDLRTGRLEPFHDRLAIDVVVQMARVLQPDEIIFIGDHLDLPEFSTKFLRSPEMYFTAAPACRELAYDIGRFKQAAPGARLIYIPGNHEKRVRTALHTYMVFQAGMVPADEPVDAPELNSIERMVGFKSLGVEKVAEYPNGQFMLNDSLAVIHGDIALGQRGATVRAVLQKYRTSVIMGHLHGVEMLWATDRDARGIEHTRLAASIGCLCRTDGFVPGSPASPDWQKAAGVVEYEPGDGMFRLDISPIVRDRTVYQGVEYHGTFDRDALIAATKWETF